MVEKVNISFTYFVRERRSCEKEESCIPDLVTLLSDKLQFKIYNDHLVDKRWEMKKIHLHILSPEKMQK